MALPGPIPLGSSEPFNIATFGQGGLDISTSLVATFGYLYYVPTGLGIDYCERAKERLIQQFKTKPNIEAYLCALTEGFQELEITFTDLFSLRQIDVAVGTQLDGLGDIIGIERDGLSDDDYRAAIQTQIVINKGNGTPEDIATVAKFITGATTCKIDQYFPGRVSLTLNSAAMPSDVVSRVEPSAPAGVALEVVATYGEASFKMAPDPGEPASSGLQGFSEPNYAPDAGLGGKITEKFI